MAVAVGVGVKVDVGVIVAGGEGGAVQVIVGEGVIPSDEVGSKLARTAGAQAARSRLELKNKYNNVKKPLGQNFINISYRKIRKRV